MTFPQWDINADAKKSLPPKLVHITHTRHRVVVCCIEIETSLHFCSKFPVPRLDATTIKSHYLGDIE